MTGCSLVSAIHVSASNSNPACFQARYGSAGFGVEESRDSAPLVRKVRMPGEWRLARLLATKKAAEAAFLRAIPRNVGDQADGVAVFVP